MSESRRLVKTVSFGRKAPPQQAIKPERSWWARGIFTKPRPTIYDRCLALHIFAAGKTSELP